MKFKILVLLIVPFMVLSANNLKFEASSPAALVEKYQEGLNNSTESLLENCLAQEVNVVVKNNILNKVTKYNKEGFLNLVEKRIIGGSKSEGQSSNLFQESDNAVIKLENTVGQVKYQSYLTCLKNGDNWEIVNVIITMTKING